MSPDNKNLPDADAFAEVAEPRDADGVTVPIRDGERVLAVLHVRQGRRARVTVWDSAGRMVDVFEAKPGFWRGEWGRRRLKGAASHLSGADVDAFLRLAPVELERLEPDFADRAGGGDAPAPTRIEVLRSGEGSTYRLHWGADGHVDLDADALTRGSQALRAAYLDRFHRPIALPRGGPEWDALLESWFAELEPEELPIEELGPKLSQVEAVMDRLRVMPLTRSLGQAVADHQYLAWRSGELLLTAEGMRRVCAAAAVTLAPNALYWALRDRGIATRPSGTEAEGSIRVRCWHLSPPALERKIEEIEEKEEEKEGEEGSA